MLTYFYFFLMIIEIESNFFIIYQAHTVING